MKVEGLVESFGYRVQASGLRVWGSGYMVQGAGEGHKTRRRRRVVYPESDITKCRTYTKIEGRGAGLARGLGGDNMLIQPRGHILWEYEPFRMTGVILHGVAFPG